MSALELIESKKRESFDTNENESNSKIFNAFTPFLRRKLEYNAFFKTVKKFFKKSVEHIELSESFIFQVMKYLGVDNLPKTNAQFQTLLEENYDSFKSIGILKFSDFFKKVGDIIKTYGTVSHEKKVKKRLN
ncbi:hypothetical protein ACTFIZ_005173 [Dictyostelium cf. discoideum]